MSEILSIKDLKLKAGDKVFIRCDFNVPMDEFLNITDDRRIRSSIPTIKYCLDEGCSVILASHLGRPKNGFEEKFSLRPVAKRLSRFLDREVKFVNDIAGYDAKMAVNSLEKGEVLLLDNLRFEKGETKNDEELAKKLAEFADFYINDALAFATERTLLWKLLLDFLIKNTKQQGFC